MTIRVVLADDEELVRSGIAMLLEASEDIEVVGQAVNGREAVREVHRLRPDVVVMDIRMPLMDGISATRSIVSEDAVATRVLVLTTFDEDQNVYEALRAGASGFLLKDAPRGELERAIRVVAQGGALLSPTITLRVVEAFARMAPRATSQDLLVGLTPREQQVLRIMARGLSNAEIADELVVGETTVRTHVSRILAKLHVRDRVQAVVLAYETGLVVPGTGTDVQ